jgi:hypothetical protein
MLCYMILLQLEYIQIFLLGQPLCSQGKKTYFLRVNMFSCSKQPSNELHKNIKYIYQHQKKLSA